MVRLLRIARSSDLDPFFGLGLRAEVDLETEDRSDLPRPFWCAARAVAVCICKAASSDGLTVVGLDRFQKRSYALCAVTGNTPCALHLISFDCRS